MTSKWAGAMMLSLMLAAACGRDEPSIPHGSSGVNLSVRVEPRSPTAPILGPVDSLVIEVRGPSGELLEPATLLAISPGQTTFRASITVPAGSGRSVSVLAIGSRPILLGPGDTDRGVLYAGRSEPFDIVPGRIETLPVTLHLFVPEFLETEFAGDSYTVRWTRIGGAGGYRLTRSSGGEDRVTTSVPDTFFVARERPQWFQVSAVDVSGRTSAPSDRIVIGAPPVPALCVAPATLNFGSELTTLPFTIRNCGIGGMLSWTAAPGASWASVDVPSGSTTLETDTVHVTVNRSGLAPGVHSTQVAVASNAGPETIPVTLEVPAVPALCVDATTLDFPAGVTERTVNVTNCGTGGTLDWTVMDDQLWLAVGPASGSTTTEQDPVTVSVHRVGLPPGTYTGNVTFTGGGTMRVVAVSLAVPAMPALCASPPALDFGASATLLELSITNCGTGGTLTWTALDDQPWLNVEPVAGTTTLETDAVMVTVNRAGLSPGDYPGTITFSSNGPPVTVGVTMNVPVMPLLCVDPGALDFGIALNELPFFITNCGSGGMLDWTARHTENWIDFDGLDTLSGSTSTETDRVYVDVYRDGLPPGDYAATVTVTSGADQRIVTVSMTVPPEPQLCLNTHLLDFGTDVTQFGVQIMNCGTGTLSWTQSDDQAWITAAPRGGSTTGSDLLTVTVDRANLAPGPHTGRVFIDSNGGADTIDVALTVPAAPMLCVDPANLDFGTQAKTLTIFITNCGMGGAVNWTVTESLPWLSLEAGGPVSGSTATETDSLHLTALRSGIPPGNYGGDVFVTSDAGSDTVHVTMVVAAQPLLCAEPDTLDFGVSATQIPFQITNCGSGGTVNWTVDENRPPWLDVSPAAGATTLETDNVGVFVNRSLLGEGTTFGRLLVNSDAGMDTVLVRVEVPPPPKLCVSPDLLDFGAAATSLGIIVANCGPGTISWSGQGSDFWIQITPQNGIVGADGAPVTVTVDRTDLTAGDHAGSVYLTSTAGSDTVAVKVSVSGAPMLCVDQTDIDFGASDDQRTFFITNCGSGGVVNWTVTDDSPWMSVNPTSGVTTTGPDGVTITVARSLFPPGFYTGVVQISSDAGTWMINVVMVN